MLLSAIPVLLFFLSNHRDAACIRSQLHKYQDYPYHNLKRMVNMLQPEILIFEFLQQTILFNLHISSSLDSIRRELQALQSVLD